MDVILNNLKMMFYYIFGTGGTDVTFSAGDLGTGSAATTINITNAQSMLGTVISTVVNNPLLLCFAILSIVGIAIGIYHRLVR